MRQLVELQKAYKEIQQHDAQVVAVFREEKLGAEGLMRVKKATGVEYPLVLDFEAKHTSRYSQGSFDTYVIDKEGVIRAVLGGTKLKRPGSEAVLAALKRFADS